MTSINLLLGLALIVYICSKQLTWRPVDPARMFKLPLILGVVGVVSLSKEAATIHPVDVVILGLSAVLAVISGALMGRIARFRRSPADPRVVETRTGALGIAIWIGLIAVRVVLDVAGHRMGSDLAVSTGSILLVLALNRATSALVVSARQPRRDFAMAGN
ncbi:hypothetical protein [Paractinoplanes toevensis]|uniref:DUF1453 domain-containing protein n=1 Tax=Paractinoplanes toevensis TaxID=571911 RepID=A0A919W7Y2_9ACTN|nr:hypothetical protein [Actinoplanes toevensis]GIM90996.1 hypothetical protein Ato02nite_027890 [Actinoplanes toevensis]